MDVITVGKTKIRITSEGCHDCGTSFSSGWFDHSTAQVSYRTRIISVRIQVCADCHKIRVRNTGSKDKEPM